MAARTICGVRVGHARHTKIHVHVRITVSLLLLSAIVECSVNQARRRCLLLLECWQAVFGPEIHYPVRASPWWARRHHCLFAWSDGVKERIPYHANSAFYCKYTNFRQLFKVAVWVQRVKKQSFDFLYFFTGSVLCMVQRVYPENLSVIGCFLPEI